MNKHLKYVNAVFKMNHVFSGDILDFGGQFLYQL